MRLVKAICCAAVLTAFLAPGARADEWNKKTILTFSGPVQIPGVTLPAGTYVFKLADLNGNRHVVQVFDKDEKKIYGTILAIPDQKLEPSDKPVVMFAERAAGTPQAVRAWFYPGETIGNEFVYPRSEAMKIARDTHQSVLSMDDTSNATTTDEERRAAMGSASVSRVDESGAASAYKSQPSPETTTAQSAQPAAPATTTAGTPQTTTAGAAPAPQTTTVGAAPAPQTTTAAAAAQPSTATPQTTTAGQPAPAPTTAAPTTAGVTRPQTTTANSSDARLKNSSGNTASNQAVGTSGQNNAPDRRRLPKTASNMTLFELFSLGALAGGFGVRRLRTREALR